MDEHRSAWHAEIFKGAFFGLVSFADEMMMFYVFLISYAVAFPYPPPEPHCPPGQILEIVVSPVVGIDDGGDFCTCACNATATCPSPAPYNASVACSDVGTCEMRCTLSRHCPPGANCVERRVGGGLCLYQ